MIYKNLNSYTLKFHGVVFEPGSIHRVPGYINAAGFLIVSEEAFSKLLKETHDVSQKQSTKPKESVTLKIQKTKSTQGCAENLDYTISEPDNTDVCKGGSSDGSDSH